MGSEFGECVAAHIHARAASSRAPEFGLVSEFGECGAEPCPFGFRIRGMWGRSPDPCPFGFRIWGMCGAEPCPKLRMLGSEFGGVGGGV